MDIVLVEPEIPQNTGSIARTCAATNTPLCLVGKLGFEISERTVRRAGLDYWPYVTLYRFETWLEYISARNPRQVWLFSKGAKRMYYTAEFGRDDALVFGSETKGLARELLERFPGTSALRIPLAQSAVRSLNLSNAVSIALYEARRQLHLDEALIGNG